MPKLAKILEQSSSTRQVSVYRSFFFSDHCMYKTKFNGFHVTVCVVIAITENIKMW